MGILKGEEVYRTLSFGVLSFILARNQHVFHTVLNPDGDIPKEDEFSVSNELQSWFRRHKLEGVCGTKPDLQVLVEAVKTCDFYVYLGHGSGKQYIPDLKIERLSRCAFSIFMGCASGELLSEGCYPGASTVLSYLLGGCPAVIANLRPVKAGALHKFGSTAPFGTRIMSSIDNCKVDFILPFLNGAATVCYGVPLSIHKVPKDSEACGERTHIFTVLMSLAHTSM